MARKRALSLRLVDQSGNKRYLTVSTTGLVKLTTQDDTPLELRVITDNAAEFSIKLSQTLNERTMINLVRKYGHEGLRAELL